MDHPGMNTHLRVYDFDVQGGYRSSVETIVRCLELHVDNVPKQDTLHNKRKGRAL